MGTHEPKPIGSLNGGYSILFRLALATYPLVLTAMIGFFSWVVVQIHDLDIWRAGTTANRFTSQDFVAAKHVLDERDNSLGTRLTLLEAKMENIAKDTKNASEMASKNNELLQQLARKP